ncbi:MAG TPA: tetratricopeptide repeat protein [Kofleriaceae bacterium]|nr:tetratricopeptide repeat protein [Kofleriaceae bacterium]
MKRIVLAALLAFATTTPAFAQREQDEESQLLVEEAKRALSKKDYERAGGLLDKALVSSPRRIDLYILRASIYGIVGKHDAAVTLLERARQLSPNNTRVNISLGVELVEVGRGSEGVPILEKIVAGDARHFDAQVVLGHYYAKQGEWKDAAKAFDAYFANRPKALAGEDSLHRYDQANSMLRSGDAKGALDLYKKLGEDKKDDRARLGVAWATAAISCKQAMPILDNLGELEAKYAEISLVRGRCALKLGRLDDAVNRAERFRKSSPNALAGWILLGDVRAAQNNWKEAEAAYLHVVEASPSDRLFALELARAERHLGKTAAAADRLKAAGPPKDYEDDWTLEYGETLLVLRRAAALKELVAPFVAAHEKNGKAQFLLGSALYILGDHAQAVGHLDAALDQGEQRAAPTFVDALNTLAAEAVKKKDLAQAASFLDKAAAAGGSTLTTRNLGAVLVAKNDLPRALEVLQKADANDADAQYVLGRALQAAKRFDDARNAYGRAIKLYGKDARVAVVQRDLAASELAAGRGEEAVAVLDAAVQTAPAGTKKELDRARLAVARSAATEAMRAARFSVAVKILRSVEKSADGDALVDLRCDLALAATGAQQRDLALDLLRGLERGKAKCPFVAPADDVGVPILIAWNEDASPKRARKTLDRLETMRRRATGVAEPLLRTAATDIAVRAAAEAYTAGNTKLAAQFLATAKSYDKRSPEVVHDLAVIDLVGGQTDNAMNVLANLVGEVPEARINIGVAYERKGEPLKALQSWKAAAAAGSRFAPLKDWIEAKERFWGAP